MKIDYTKMNFTKRCWYCSAKAMKKQDSFYTCKECGATWCKSVKLGPEEIVMRPDPARGNLSASPSDFVVRRIRKQREAKKDAVNNQCG